MKAISKRMNEILNAIWRFSKPAAQGEALVLDVGTDHGWVPYLAAQKKLSNNVICSDISEKCLAKARKRFRNWGDESIAVDFRVGDGLEVLGMSEHVDVCIIAGMGFAQIHRILTNSKEKLNNVDIFVFQVRYDDMMAKVLEDEFGFDVLFDKAVIDNGMVYRTMVCMLKSKGALQGGAKYDKLHDTFGTNSLDFVYFYDIDYKIYGMDNLFDHSKEHLKALNTLLIQNVTVLQGISAGIKKQAKNNTISAEILEQKKFVEHKIESLDKIIEFLKVGANIQQK